LGGTCNFRSERRRTLDRGPASEKGVEMLKETILGGKTKKKYKVLDQNGGSGVARGTLGWFGGKNKPQGLGGGCVWASDKGRKKERSLKKPQRGVKTAHSIGVAHSRHNERRVTNRRVSTPRKWAGVTK